MKNTDERSLNFDRMASVMRPEHYVGFLLGAAFLSLIEQPEPDYDGVRLYMEEREAFVRRQREAHLPDGMPVPPVYWTDEIRGYDDREELIACMDGNTVFALHSSVEPHMEWVVRMPIGEGEFELETFPTKAAGEKAIKELQEENRRQYGIMIAEVRHLYAMGDIAGAENRMGMWDVEVQGPLEGPPPVMVVDGERMTIGKPPAYKKAAIETVKQHLREGKFEAANAICRSYGVSYAWDSGNPHVAWIEGEALDLFTFNVRNPNAEASPGRQVPRAYDHHPV